jgi:hypothetical protein
VQAVVEEYAWLVFRRSKAPIAIIFGKANFDRYFAAQRSCHHTFTIGSYQPFKKDVHGALEYLDTTGAITRIVFFFPHPEAFLRQLWARDFGTAIAKTRSVALALADGVDVPVRPLNFNQITGRDVHIYESPTVKSSATLRPGTTLGALIKSSPPAVADATIVALRLFYLECKTGIPVPREYLPEILAPYIDYPYRPIQRQLHMYEPFLYLARVIAFENPPQWFLDDIPDHLQKHFDSRLGQVGKTLMWPILHGLRKLQYSPDSAAIPGSTKYKRATTRQKYFSQFVKRCVRQAGVPEPPKDPDVKRMQHYSRLL